MPACPRERPAGLLGARIGPAAAPGRSSAKPARPTALRLCGAELFRADTDSRFPSLRVFPARLKLNKIVFRVAREGAKPHYCLIHT